MPGVPPTSPRLGLPRYDQTDPATFAPQVNAIVDTLDPLVQKVGDPLPNGLVTDAMVAAAAAIQETKLSLATDASANVGSRRTLGTGPLQACAGNDPRLTEAKTPTAHAATHQAGGSDDTGVPPIGTVLAYAGTALPAGGKWAWADGALIDRTTYATLYGLIGHAYNGNVDPGSNKFRLPDKRGRSSVGAINYGQGSGGTTTDRAQAARGENGGVREVTLTLTHIPGHDHGGGNHQHAITGSRDTNNGFTMTILGGGGFTHTSEYSGAVITPQGSGQPHTNLHPFQADNYLVRVL